MNIEVTTIAQRAAEALASGSIVLTMGFLLLGLISTTAILTAVGIILIYAERKVAAHFQCRLGPMRVGWHGILQPFADAIKLLLKEDLVPEKADKLLHLVAPFLSISATVLTLAILPFAPSFQIVDLNIGVVYFSGITGVGVLGVLLGGWSSHNKWSLLGAMRAGAQIISYELSATLSILVIVLFSGTLKLSEIVQSQMDGWWIWKAHIVGVIAFVSFLISTTAELNRTPFDLPEGESELAAGFHTEYSGMRFSFFFLAEFVNMFIASSIMVTLFFGGWMPFHIGNWESFNAVMDFIPPAIWFGAKSVFFIFVYMWIRWTFPRLRVDQMMRLEWKFLLPIGFFNLLLGAVLVLSGLHF